MPSRTSSESTTAERVGQHARRIVLVAHSHVVGGIERHVVTLAEALSGMGHHVAFAGPLDGWLGNRMRDAGCACLHLPMHGMYDLWSAWRLVRFCRSERAELLHGHAQRGARYASWAARRLGLPAVATAHSTQAWKWFDPDTTLIAVSRAVRDALIAAGIRAERIHVVHSGVADIGATPLPGACAPPEAGSTGPARRPLVLGMLSRLERVKGHDIALEALAALRSRMPVRLAIVGPEDTDWARQVRAMAASLAARALAATREAAHPLGRAIDYMQAYFARPITLTELAGAVNLSPYHFQRSFKTRFHVTPQQMLMAIRLQRAKGWLAAGLPAAEVAAACGLADQSHLNRAFLRRYGTTPVRYQKQVQSGR